ncbi:MAG: hypothetical protein HYX48_05725 [Chlamydiales bacterium]|nr:hypothetical protein [Chlamydiales bacterium]
MRRVYLFRCALFCLAFWGVKEFCERATDGFTIAEVLSSRPYNSAWEVKEVSASEKEEVDRALDQTYTYFGKGGQAFVFFSEDGRYVLKLMRQKRLELPLFSKYRSKKTLSRMRKVDREFGSYKDAFNELKEETGLLYVHLNKTHEWKKKIALIDRLNIRHMLDAGNLDFIIQKRAELVHERIDRLMSEGKKSEAEGAIRELFHLIAKRKEKGFRDRDPNIRTNCGFIGEHAVKIDVGALIKREKLQKPVGKKERIENIAAPFRSWLEVKHPLLLPCLQRELENAEQGDPL